VALHETTHEKEPLQFSWKGHEKFSYFASLTKTQYLCTIISIKVDNRVFQISINDTFPHLDAQYHMHGKTID
jgi:hypothetical protein